MNVEIFVALAGFALAASITPGPNNLMLLASGVNFGFARTLPHMLGIGFGFALLLLGVGLGIGQLLETAPRAFTVLKILCAVYLVYLCWRIATAGPVHNGHRNGRPMTFLEAAAFQWVNPKGWFMSITAMSVYTSVDEYLLSVLLVAGVFVAILVPSVSIWCGMGTALRSWLSDATRLRAFNITMALLLLGSLWLVIA